MPQGPGSTHRVLNVDLDRDDDPTAPAPGWAPRRMVRLVGALRELSRRAAESGATPLSLLRRAMRLRRTGGLGLRDCIDQGLLDPALPSHALDAALSKMRMVELQRPLNPQSRECLTEDKALYYAYCQSLGVPVPKLYAVFGSLGGYDRYGKDLVGKSPWVDFIEHTLPDEFVVKPAYGYYGIGVRVFQRDGHDLVDHSGRQRTAANLFDELHAGGAFRKFIFQERMRPHSRLAELSNSLALQTARVITLVRDDGKVTVENAILRLARSDQIIDNIHGGRTGNLAARIDLQTGRLAEGWMFDEHRSLIRTDRHPQSRNALRGFQLPDWQRALSLVRRAAVLFLPSRCLGWDVAFTGNGPLLLEANMHWDPLNLMGIDLSAAAGQRTLRDSLHDMRLIGSNHPAQAED